MNTEFEYMIKLFINGAFGEKTSLPQDADIKSVIRMANAHNIYFSIMQSLMLNESELNISDDIKEKIRKDLKDIQIKTCVKQAKLAEIFKQFENQGIPYALLKGYSVAALYKDPYSRVSSDIDVLVNPEDEKKAMELLQKYGFTVQKLREEEDKHGLMWHPVFGLLELHISLYNKKTAEVWFNAAHKKFNVEVSRLEFNKLEKVSLDGIYFYTLDINKRIEYLFLHNVKHFILGGSCIRAIMDFFLTYTKSEGIDYNLFQSKLEVMGLKALFNTMISVIERYMSFDGINVPLYEKSDDFVVDAFLEDMYTGRWLGYGSESVDTEVGWRIYEQEKLKNMSNMPAKPAEGKIRLLFPPIKKLRNHYKYALKYPILVPVAWVHRLVRGLFGKRLNTNRADLLNDSSNMRRVELLKQVGIM